MLEWWSGIGFLGQILACIAIPSTIVLVVQTVMVLVSGFDGGTEVGSEIGTETDVDSVDFDDIDDIVRFDQAGLQIFTIRGFITFFSIFGWAGIWLLTSGLPPSIALLIAFALGATAMVGTAYVMRFLMKLQAKGNQNIRDAVGASGTVYIQIPAGREGLGKVSAVVSGRYSEFDAVTDDEQTIPTGNAVTIIAVTEPNILVVTKK